MEVDENDFYEMEDGTIMARAPNGKFHGKVETETHPISLYLDRDLGPEKEDDLRTFGSWLPYSREDGEHDKNVYSNLKIPIQSLTRDINTPWRDLKTGRPEGESRAASIPIEFNEGEKDDFSRESEDYMYVTIMQSDRHGPWYPVFTIPNEGDVERKLDVTGQVMGELSELQNLGQREWSEINRYFPTELLSDLDTAHQQADFVDEALENGYLEAEEQKELHVNEDPRFVNRGVSNIKLASGDEELELTYTDQSIGGSHHSEPSDRIHHTDFFKMMEWFEDRDIDVDYSVERSDEYEGQLVADILSHAARSWEGRDDFREEAPYIQLLGQEEAIEDEEDLGQIAHDAYRLRNQIMDEAIEELNEDIVEALGERRSEESNYDLGELVDRASNYQREMRHRPMPGHDMDGEYDLSTAAHASSTAADQLYELVEQHHKDSPEPAAE